MFGCFHGDAPVVLADGSRLPIGEIVDGRLPVEVLSFDPITGRIEPRPVVSWFDNGVADEFLRIRVSGGVDGAREIVCTANHTIFTPYGEMSAGDLRPGSEVLAALMYASVMQPVGAAAGGGGTALAEPPARASRAYVLGVERVRDLPSMRRYDLEIEGNHTYLVDEVVVHNSPEVTPGGRALKFYASVRLDIRRIETLKEGTEAFGNRVRVKVVKNKVAPPFRQAEFDIIYGEGISHEGGLLDLGLEKGIVTKSGSYFSCGDERLGQGRNAARAFLREHPDMAANIEARLREMAGFIGGTIPDAPPAEVDGVEVPTDEVVATT
jgi:recombination protein RecA